MKKILVSAAMLLALPSCSGSLDIVTDEETGCQYINSYRGGYTPRLDPDGKPICKKQ